METNVRDRLEEALRRRRTTLLQAAGAREAALQGFAEERESELEEGAQEAEIGRALCRLDDLERREVTEIDAALDRIADGAYGRCTRCDGTIEIDRLAAIPEAALCIRCAGEQE